MARANIGVEQAAARANIGVEQAAVVRVNIAIELIARGATREQAR